MALPTIELFKVRQQHVASVGNDHDNAAQAKEYSHVICIYTYLSQALEWKLKNEPDSYFQLRDILEDMMWIPRWTSLH